MSQQEPETNDPDVEKATDILEAFNAEEVIERPGKPPRPEPSPTSDAEVPPPQ